MREQHPLSVAFPAVPEADFRALVEDILQNGQREAIVIYDEMVLDGWHRYRACSEIGRPCTERGLPPGLDPVAYVHSQNLHRRHLTASQRAAAVAATAEWANPGRPKGTSSENVAPGATLNFLAKSANVSERTIRQAKTAQVAGLGDAVRDGKISVKRAAEIAKLPEDEREAAIEAHPEPAHSKKEDADSGQLDELVRMLAECQADCESMARVFEASDKMVAAMAEASRFREQARVMDARNKGMQSEIADLKGLLKSANRKIQKLEKELEAARAPA